MAFLADAKGSGKHLQPLMQGIAAGYWIGVVSSVSLIRVLEGPLACGDEALAQRYARAFENPVHWQLVTDHPALAQTGLHPVLSALRL